MKIDMHTHTKGSDGTGTPEQISKAAKAAGLDGICLTDHNKTYSPESLEVAAACRALGVRVFHGCEYSSGDGHILIYGCNFADLGLGWYAPMQQVLDTVFAHGGVAIPSHPYLGYKRKLGDGMHKLRGLVAVEIANGQNQVRNPDVDQQAKAAATLGGFKGLGGSDAHFPDNTGIVYTRFDQAIVSDRDLVHALTYGSYEAVATERAVPRPAKPEQDLTALLTASLDTGASKRQAQGNVPARNQWSWLDEVPDETDPRTRTRTWTRRK